MLLASRWHKGDSTYESRRCHRIGTISQAERRRGLNAMPMDPCHPMSWESESKALSRSPLHVIPLSARISQQTCMYTSHVTISDSHRRDSHPISPYYSNLIRSIEIQLTVMTTDQVVTAGFPFVERRVILRWQERGSTFVRCLWPVVYRMCPCGCGRGRGAERSVVWPMTISYE
jgi:hypothetical protein